MPSRKPNPSTQSAHGLAGRTGRRANASKPASQKKAASLRFRITSAQEKRYNAAAAKTGKDLSKWIRDTLDSCS